MTWLPLFKLGLWNAWILTLFMALHPLIMILVDRFFGTGNIFKKMGEAPTEKKEKLGNTISSILLYAILAFSLFLPLKIGTCWFYVGLSVYLIGIVIFLSAIFTAAKTPPGRIFSRGIYRYSRHPLYLSFFIIFMGVSIASASWLFFLLTMGWTCFPVLGIASEEQGCLKAFGKEYQEYMDRTPRWFGYPKSG